MPARSRLVLDMWCLHEDMIKHQLAVTLTCLSDLAAGRRPQQLQPEEQVWEWPTDGTSKWVSNSTLPVCPCDSPAADRTRA